MHSAFKYTGYKLNIYFSRVRTAALIIHSNYSKRSFESKLFFQSEKQEAQLHFQ